MKTRNRRPWLGAVLLAVGLVLPTGGLGAAEMREVSSEFEVGEGQIIRIEIPVADIEIEAADRKSVQAELTLRCRWQLDDCRKTLEEAELVSRTSSRRLVVELTGVTKWRSSQLDVDARLLVPRSAALEVEMGVGEVDILGVEKDLRVEVGVGEINVWIRRDKVGRVALDAGVGQVELTGEDHTAHERRPFFLGSEAHWQEGTGEARLDIEVGVGTISVWLEESP